MGLFSKKEAPDQLPELAMDTLTEKPTKFTKEMDEPVPQKKFSPKPLPRPMSAKQMMGDSPIETSNKETISSEDDKGFFRDVLKNVTENTENLDKLDTWYQNKFLPGDIVFQMREYWEKQQPEILLKNISGELKQKLMDKTNRLHQLEKDWQEIYFNLLSKEEEIRKEEKELKEHLSEFMKIVKKTYKNAQSF